MEELLQKIPAEDWPHLVLTGVCIWLALVAADLSLRAWEWFDARDGKIDYPNASRVRVYVRKAMDCMRWLLDLAPIQSPIDKWVARYWDVVLFLREKLGKTNPDDLPEAP